MIESRKPDETRQELTAAQKAIGHAISPMDKYGLKLEPITIAELANVRDIRYRIWRETYANEMVALIQAKFGGKLPLFVDYGAWFVINDADKTLFKFPNMAEKYDKSDSSRAIRRGLARAASMAPSTGRDDTDESTASIDSASTMFELSRVVVVTPSARDMSPFDHIASINGIEQYVLSLAAAFIILHDTVGVMHRDPTTNNIGAQQTYRPHLTIVSRGVAYNMVGPIACVIDFSRVLVNPYHPNIECMTPANREFLASSQASTLAAYVKNTISPDDALYSKITELIGRDFARAFNILSMTDLIGAIRYRAAGMDTHEGSDLSVVAKLRDYERMCTDMMKSHLMKPNDAPSYDPSRDFIAKAFEAFSVARAPAKPSSASEHEDEEHVIVDLDTLTVSSRDIQPIDDEDMQHLRVMSEMSMDDDEDVQTQV
jgi:hypothetical protein